MMAVGGFKVITQKKRGSFGLDGKKEDERQIQRSIVAWARRVAPDARTQHVPMNQANRVAGAIMKGDGAAAGFSDLIVIAPGGKTLFLEVKTSSGKLSEAQKSFANDLQLMGHNYSVVRSIDDARVAFDRAGIKMREIIA